MRNFLVVLLLAAGCASAPADPSRPKISIEAYERGQQTRNTTLTGMHSYVIRVINKSDMQIVVDSIRLDPGFGGGVEMIDNSQKFDDEVGGMSTGDFDMYVTVSAGRDRAAEMKYTLDSLRVEVGYHVEGGKNYFESCSCEIKRVSD
jgi:hypothetical protein